MKKYFITVILLMPFITMAQDNNFIGFSIGGGYGYSKPMQSLVGSASFDGAVSVNKAFALGGYISYKTMNNISAGILSVTGENGKTGFIFGAGVNFRIPRSYEDLDNCEFLYDRNVNLGIDSDLRFGVKFSAPVYLFLNLNIGNISGADYYDDEYLWTKPFAQVTLNVGYYFNR